jgi:glucose-6-phosphate 1-epimerase
VVEEEAAPADARSVTLALQSHKVIKALWPYAFACALTVALHDKRLVMTLTVTNNGAEPFSFQAALHTYLAIGAIESISLAGLENHAFEDCTQADGPVLKPHTPLRPFEAIDRIYFDAPAHLQLQSAQGLVDLQQSGFCDVVVWNPGGAAAASPPDLPKDGFRHFLCVEAARIGKPVELGPQQVWSGTQSIQAAVLGAQGKIQP